MTKATIIHGVLLIIITVVFGSCNSPLHRAYSPATYEEDMKALRSSNKVSDEDLQTLAKYVMLARLSGHDLTGQTYEDMIDKIKSLQQNNSELHNREAMEKEARRIRLSPFLQINLKDKTYGKKNSNNVLVFTVLFKNTGARKIKTVTGNLVMNDLMGKPIKKLPVFLDEDILPGQSLIKIYTSDYNDSDESDRRMRSKDLVDIRAVWDPEKIIFDDGLLAE